MSTDEMAGPWISLKSDQNAKRSAFRKHLNYHHSERLGSRITDDAHGVAAFDFATMAHCSQLVNGLTHRSGGVLDLVLTNVPDLCNVNVQGNVGRSDHASL